MSPAGSVDPGAVAGFLGEYRGEPDVVVRAPGRVNIIGEHTDYALLPVVPVAIDRAVSIAAAGDDTGRVRAGSAAFGGVVDLDRGAKPGPGWDRYVGSVLRVLEGRAPGRGARIWIGGDLTPDGGLSSSSALTVGLLKAFDVLWSLGLSADDIVESAVAAERAIGIEGGTMDQTVITFAEPGAALRIDFHPPARRPVPIDPRIRLVAADSGRRAPKSGAMRDLYDSRVLGVRMAGALLAAALGADAGNPPLPGRLVRSPEMEAAAAGLPLEATAVEVAAAAGIDVEALCRMTARRMDPHLRVPVRAVAVHVLGEAARVDAAEAALTSGDVGALGSALDASHRSLVRFGVSTPELDGLVAGLRRAGASGARLTGAGGGGFVVAAATPETVASVVDAGRASAGSAFEVVPSAGVRWSIAQ